MQLLALETREAITAIKEFIMDISYIILFF